MKPLLPGNVLRAKKRAVGGKRPRCKKGKSCSAACINRNKVCLVGMPTPASNAIPKAIKAIQNRPPRNEANALNPRAKKLQGSRKNLIKELNKRFDQAVLSRDTYRLYDIMDSLKRLGFKEGDYQSRRRKLERTYRRFDNSMISLVSKMQVAAMYGDRAKYDRLEDKLLAIKRKAGNTMLWKQSFKYRDAIEKGGIWKEEASERAKRRDSKLQSKFSFLAARAKLAVQSGDRKEYDKLEKALLKIQSKAADRLNLDKSDKVRKGSIWRAEKLAEYAPKLMEKYEKSMKAALESGNLDKYYNIEDQVIKLRRTLEDNKTLDRIPRVKAFRRDVMRDDFVLQLRADRQGAINRNNFRDYNRVESLLFKLDPNNSSNIRERLWVRDKMEGTFKKMKDDMEKAADSGDRTAYDKVEERFLRVRTKLAKRFGPAAVLDDWYLRHIDKGDMWSRVRGGNVGEKLRDSDLMNGRPGTEGIKIRGKDDDFTISSKVLGNRLKISLSLNDSTSFTVNDSHTDLGNLTKTERVSIIREVRRQYNEIFSKMEDGTVFQVSAASSDGKGKAREKAYVATGFSEPDSDGNMYGMIRRGKVTPIDVEDYRRARRGEEED